MKIEWDRPNFLSFWAIFCHFTYLTPQKIKILKKWKKHLVMSSFYIFVPKITVIYNVCFPRYGQIFLTFWTILPYYWPQNLKFGKNVKNNWMYPFLHVYHKWRSSGVWFLRYKTQWTVLCHFEPFFHLWPS